MVQPLDGYPVERLPALPSGQDAARTRHGAAHATQAGDATEFDWPRMSGQSRAIRAVR
jgi:hypothetical protein